MKTLRTQYTMLILLVSCSIFYSCTKKYYNTTSTRIYQLEESILNADSYLLNSLDTIKELKTFPKLNRLRIINNQIDSIHSDWNSTNCMIEMFTETRKKKDTICFKNILPFSTVSSIRQGEIINLDTFFYEFVKDSISLMEFKDGQVLPSRKNKNKDSNAIIVSPPNMNRFLILDEIIHRREAQTIDSLNRRKEQLLLQFYSLKSTYNKITPRRWLRRFPCNKSDR